MFFVIIGWVFFRVIEVGHAYDYVKAMFGAGSGEIVQTPGREWFTIFGVALFFAFFVIPKRGQQLQDLLYTSDTLKLRGHFAMSITAMLLFLISVSYITAGGFNPFIYFRF